MEGKNTIYNSIFIFCFLYFSAIGSSLPHESRKIRIFSRSWVVMGTLLKASVWAKEYETANKNLERIFAEVRSIESIMSSYMEDSELNIINRKAYPEWHPMSNDMNRVILIATQVYHESRSAFDISVMPLVHLWGFKNRDFKIPSKWEIQHVLSKSRFQNVLTDQKRKSIRFLRKGVKLDLGGIAKGYALDKMVLAIKEEIDCALIQLGGQVYYHKEGASCPKQSIGIQHPQKSLPIARVTLRSSGSLATSGNYENFFLKDAPDNRLTPTQVNEQGNARRESRYSHIIDTATGYPLKNSKTVSVTVWHRSAALADAWSTALFVMGNRKRPEALDCPKRLNAIWILRGKNSGSSGFRVFVQGELDFYLQKNYKNNILRRSDQLF